VIEWFDLWFVILFTFKSSCALPKNLTLNQWNCDALIDSNPRVHAGVQYTCSRSPNREYSTVFYNSADLTGRKYFHITTFMITLMGNTDSPKHCFLQLCVPVTVKLRQIHNSYHIITLAVANKFAIYYTPATAVTFYARITRFNSFKHILSTLF